MTEHSFSRTLDDHPGRSPEHAYRRQCAPRLGQGSITEREVTSPDPPSLRAEYLPSAAAEIVRLPAGQIIRLWRVGLAGVYVVAAEHSLRDDGTGESQTLAWQDWLWQAGCCLLCPKPEVIIFVITSLLWLSWAAPVRTGRPGPRGWHPSILRGPPEGRRDASPIHRAGASSRQPAGSAPSGAP